MSPMSSPSTASRCRVRSCGQFSQNLVADGRDTVERLGRGHELADAALIVIGQTAPPGDFRTGH